MFMVAKKLSEPYEKYHKVIFKTDDMDHIINVLGTEKFSMKTFPDKFIELEHIILILEQLIEYKLRKG